MTCGGVVGITATLGAMLGVCITLIVLTSVLVVRILRGRR